MCLPDRVPECVQYTLDLGKSSYMSLKVSPSPGQPILGQKSFCNCVIALTAKIQ